jgi:hypothetical protein
LFALARFGKIESAKVGKSWEIGKRGRRKFPKAMD